MLNYAVKYLMSKYAVVSRRIMTAIKEQNFIFYTDKKDD